MAKNTQLTNLVVNTQADALSALLDGGFIDIMDGSQPADGDTAITDQNVLVSLTLNATFAPSATAGVLTANSITSGVAGNSGTATWFRVYKDDHTTALFDGSVGTSDANLILPTASITAGQTVAAASFSYTVAKSTSGS